MQLRRDIYLQGYTNIRGLKLMIEEKHHLNTKWYLSGDLKIRQQDLGDGRIGIWVSFQEFNVCFTMIMYHFIK